jgi:predicted AAA+ superfamily ATPase
MTTVLIKNGVYRRQPVVNVAFTLVKDYQTGVKGNFVTVKSDGYFGEDHDVVRIKLDSIEEMAITNQLPREANKMKLVSSSTVVHETDEEVMDRIEQRFDILQQMTRATISGDVRAMIVVGPPGVGKSYGVEYELEKSGMFDKIANRRIKYEIIKGAMTPIGLYCTLYRMSDPQNVLVFDDCDAVFQDDLSLNILKAALDSGKKRKIYWNSDSAMLRREGVPDSFDFKGSAIFITNLKFQNVKSKKMQDHLEALQSRCHFLDLTLDTVRDKLLRIKQIFRQGYLFKDYNFEPTVGEEIIEFMRENQNRLREISLRMALKLADLTKVSETEWKTLAVSTCMKNS